MAVNLLAYTPALLKALQAVAPVAGQAAVIGGVGTAAVTGTNNLIQEGIHKASGEKRTRAQLQAENETLDEKGRLNSWGLGDTISSWTGGPSRADVQAAAVDAESERITKGYKPALSNINSTLSDLGLSYTPTDFVYGQTNEGVYAQGIERAGIKAGKLAQIAELNKGALPGDLDMSSSVSALNTRISDLTRAKEIAQSEEIGGARYNARKAEERQRIQDAKEEHRFTQQMLQRDADRELQRQLANDKLQISTLQLQGQQEDRRYRRESDRRAQQQQSIMMLMKGLTQLGAGFAI